MYILHRGRIFVGNVRIGNNSWVGAVGAIIVQELVGFLWEKLHDWCKVVVVNDIKAVKHGGCACKTSGWMIIIMRTTK